MTDVHPRSGSFDTIRLLAALMVLHSHMFALAGLDQPTLPGGSYGAIAVVIFFVVSGYWVSRSAVQRSLAAYASARALRIVPGLAVCCAVTVLACALATSLPVNDYLRHPKTWAYLWNAVPFFHVPVLGMPGVFEDGAVKDAPNGSLWTLRYEVMCYVLVALAAVFGPKGVRAFVAAAAIFGLAVAAQALGGAFDAINARYVVLTDFLQVGWIAMFVGAFAFGAWLQEADERRLRQAIGVSAAAMLLGHHDATFAQVISIFLYGSVAVWVGRNLNLDRRVTRGQDISYGVYIYAFPCQQLAVRWIPEAAGAGFLTYYAVALGGTVVLAWLSWVLVERPALRLKGPAAGALERLTAAVAGRWEVRSGNGGDLAQQAGRPGALVDPIDADAVLRRSAGH
ncbi:acyltransferase [Phenylobacterium sp. J367]|uniref:acyltransferase family protein n=1 Tax=Phenylobacterium sp. J367 TaxID=2898435 RepID=UPI0021514A7A|nr:acyltransferase [Phenylobacterium sp. J367]MCR5879121.1 acyltransferase [Phenylobacterium sp. J367]